MKKILFFTVIALFISALVFSSYDEEEDSTSPAYLTKQFVLDELLKTNHKLIDLFNAAKAEDSTGVAENFKAARIQYKLVEFYLESFESDYIKFINGAPIPYVEYVGGSDEAQQPHGFQVIEELIFDNPTPDYKKIIDECFDLNKELIKFLNVIEVNPTSDASVFLGLKYGMIRIETLSIPGFDCAITLQVAQEIYSSLQSVKTVLGFYANANKDQPIFPTINKTITTINNAQKYLQPKPNHYLGFEDIDKLYFIKKYVQPIDSSLVDIFNTFKSDKPTVLRIFKYITQINGDSKNTYDPKFLDVIATGEKNYYGINKEEKLKPEIIALGNKLFNDVRLSHTNTLSCATCHISQKAFTDGLPKAVTNVPGKFQKRNSPTIVYSAFQGRQFTDMRSKNLEDQIVHVVNNPEEFNTSFEEIVGKLSQDSALVKEFIQVFPEDWKKPIKEFTIRKALGEYVRSLGTFNSEFDAYMRGEISDLPPDVKRGFNLFMGKAKCGTCHFPPTFSGTTPPLYRESDSEVLGVLEKWDTIHPVLTADSGRYHFQMNPIYITSHKTPTLRNVELTGPYMHNGQWNNLEDILEFYNRGGGVGMGLKIDNQTMDDVPLNLSDTDKRDIIAFLKSLTDRQFLNGDY